MFKVKERVCKKVLAAFFNYFNVHNEFDLIFQRRKNTNTIIYALDIEDEMSRDIKSRPQSEEIDLLQ